MIFAQAEAAAEPKSEIVKRVAWVYAGILVVMAVAQLFGFEKFMPIIADYWLPGGAGTVAFVAGVVVASEVFALPYLLRMRLSPLMRWFGLVCSFVVPLVWIGLSVGALAGESAIANGGILGAKVTVPLGAQLVVAIGLLVLAAWSARGLAPLSQK